MNVMLNGHEIDFEAAVILMDDGLREELHSEMAGSCTEQEFLDAYVAAHLRTHQEQFEV